jgi:prepilin-type N-terminal cleavage/methylation domain-containing protein
MSRHDTAHRRSPRDLHLAVRCEGFTLIELVAAIAVIVVLAGLLLPAVQRVREAANQEDAANYLTGLAAVMQDFHRANGKFPDTWARVLEVAKGPADGAIAGFQLSPQQLSAHELIVYAEPVAGVTGSDTLRLRIMPTADGTFLQSEPIAGADEARNRMFERLLNFTAEEIAALVYLLPLPEQEQLFATVVPLLEQAPSSPDVMNALASLTPDGVFSLASFFENAEQLAVEDSGLHRRFAAYVDRTRAILDIGAYHEQLSLGGVMVKNVVEPGANVADLVYSFGALTALTSSYLSDDRGRKAGLAGDQVRRELLHLLEQAMQADSKGDEVQKARWLGQYIGLAMKLKGVLLSNLEADTLIGIARSL